MRSRRLMMTIMISGVVASGCSSAPNDAERKGAREARYDRSAAAGYKGDGTPSKPAVDPRSIRVTLNIDLLKGCQSLGTVTVGEGVSDADWELRTLVAELGGNSALAVPVQTHEVKADGSRRPIDSGDKHKTELVPGQILGEAYLCEQPKQ